MNLCIPRAAGRKKISTVTIIPGYDDTGRLPPRPITDRWCGETQRVLWQQAIAAVPYYALITSRNEWHERSELEFSVECSSCALLDTAAFSRRFRAKQRQPIKVVAWPVDAVRCR
jgi:hypothetical protein